MKSAEKKIKFTQNYNKRRGPSHRSGNWISRNDNDKTRRSLAYAKQLSYQGAMMSNPHPDTRGNFRPSNLKSNNFSRNQPFERRDYQNNNNNRYNDYRARSLYRPDQDQSRDWGSNNNYSGSLSTPRQDSSFTDFRRQRRSDSPNPSVFNRFGNQDPSKTKSNDKKLPMSNKR